MEEYEVYYKEIAENTGIPVIVYNIPDMSSVHFSESDIGTSCNRRDPEA